MGIGRIRFESEVFLGLSQGRRDHRPREFKSQNRCVYQNSDEEAIKIRSFFTFTSIDLKLLIFTLDFARVFLPRTGP